MNQIENEKKVEKLTSTIKRMDDDLSELISDYRKTSLIEFIAIILMIVSIIFSATYSWILMAIIWIVTSIISRRTYTRMCLVEGMLIGCIKTLETLGIAQIGKGK